MGALRAALTLRSSPPPEDCRLVISEPPGLYGQELGEGGGHIGLSPVSSPTVTRWDGLLEEVEGIFLQLILSLSKPI